MKGLVVQRIVVWEVPTNISAMYVEKSFKAFTSKFTKELFTLERSYTLVVNAKNHSAHPLSLEITLWYILKKDHFHATNVKSLSNTNIIY